MTTKQTKTTTVAQQTNGVDLQAEIARLKAENEALKARPTSRVFCKVSEKGAVSVYGLGRFPVTLYQEQMLKLLAMSGDIQAFIRDNATKLSAKA